MAIDEVKLMDRVALVKLERVQHHEEFMQGVCSRGALVHDSSALLNDSALNSF